MQKYLYPIEFNFKGRTLNFFFFEFQFNQYILFCKINILKDWIRQNLC